MRSLARHSKALGVSVRLRLQTRSLESFVNRPKTAQRPISVSPGVTPNSGVQPQGDPLQGRALRKCRVSAGSHTLHQPGPECPQRVTPRPRSRRSIRSPCLCLHVLSTGLQWPRPLKPGDAHLGRLRPKPWMGSHPLKSQLTSASEESQCPG